jgi:hypothetical protein
MVEMGVVYWFRSSRLGMSEWTKERTPVAPRKIRTMAGVGE